MPVFISHRTTDNGIALQVAARLRNYHGIECYMRVPYCFVLNKNIEAFLNL